MMKSERLDELIQKYTLGNLTESEASELSDHLNSENAEDARRKLRLALRADAYLQEAAAEMDSSSSKTVKGRKILSLDRILWPLGSIAAALVIGMLTWSYGPKKQSAEDTRVGTIHRIEGVAKNQDGTAIQVGSALEAEDKITMDTGLVEIVFRDTGVHAVATAPLVMTVHGADKVFLHRGDLKLHVPPQGVGFVVETEEREITDLGTSFVVSARQSESRVLVLEGLVSVGTKVGVRERYMSEGEAATFSKKGDIKMVMNNVSKIPDISAIASKNQTSLPGKIYTLKRKQLPSLSDLEDVLGKRLLPLVNSGFQNRNSLEKLRATDGTFPFTGISGAYNQFAERHGLDTDTVNRAGWVAWHSGKLTPPKAGRYRFWGYADNHLLVAVNNKPVFEAGRYDSAFRKSAKVPRQNHPALPCLNSRAGFASGPWFEVGDTAVNFDLLFGEKKGNLTYGLLLIEHEGESYEKTAWGQPKWPVFLTQPPTQAHQQELKKLRAFMEQKLLGSFAVAPESAWSVME